GRPRGLPRRPRGADRHQPPRAGATRSADGPPQLALLLDRDRREIRGDRAEPDRHLSPARHRPLCLSGRCAPARRPAPCRRCRATHPKAVEATLRGQSASIRSPPALEVGKNAARLPLTCVGHLPFEHQATVNGGFSILPTEATDPDLTVAEAKSWGLLPGRTRRSGATLPPLAEPSDARPPLRWTKRRRPSNVSHSAMEAWKVPRGRNGWIRP